MTALSHLLLVLQPAPRGARVVRQREGQLSSPIPVEGTLDPILDKILGENILDILMNAYFDECLVPALAARLGPGSAHHGLDETRVLQGDCKQNDHQLANWNNDCTH